MPRPLLVALASLLIGLGLGFVVWGAPALRTKQNLLRDLGAITQRLEEHEQTLTRLVVEREARAGAALTECEQAQEKIATELEGCLFERAGQRNAEPAQRPRSGTSAFDETIDYPVPIPPREH